jgi:hypothetical protein
MDKELKEKLLFTYGEFLKVIKEIKNPLILRVDEDTMQEIKKTDLKIPFNLVCNLPNSDPEDKFRKIKLVKYKWIWNIPEIKRSYAGRILNEQYR